jgi:hypothetical protein
MNINQHLLHYKPYYNWVITMQNEELVNVRLASDCEGEAIT